MAIWNTSNILHTLEGRKVLSKVQAGVDKLTVTRIVTGSGRVNPAQLYNQLQVTEIQQEMSLLDVETDENGSSLEIQVSNLNLTQGYNLNQIGIYVSHPDFDNEVLYLIAQCDSTPTSTPDYIPTPDITPLALNFSMYMEHSGTTNVEFTINLAGMVTIAQFNDLRDRVEVLENNTYDLTQRVESLEETRVKIPTIDLVSINHNLGRYPVVTVVEINVGAGVGGAGDMIDDSGTVCFVRPVYLDSNNVKILVSEDLNFSDPTVVKYDDQRYIVSFSDTQKSLEVLFN